MKRFLKTVGISGLLCGALLAQRPFGPRDGTGSGTAADSATRIARQVTRLTTLLDLTSAQATQITTTLTNAETASTAARTNLSTDRTALLAAIKSNATGTIDQLSTAIGTIEGQVLAIGSKAEAAIYAVLTSTQQTKLETVGGLNALGGGPGSRGPGGPRRE